MDLHFPTSPLTPHSQIPRCNQFIIQFHQHR